MDGDQLLAPFERLLADICPPAEVRAIEAGGEAVPMWRAFEESGFLDSLVPEASGGAGLSLSDIAPLLEALGRHAVPLPVAETMVARVLLTHAGIVGPRGPIVLATASTQPTWPVPLAGSASHALVDRGDELLLVRLSSAAVHPTGVFRGLSAYPCWQDLPPGPTAPPVEGGLRPIAAVLRAAAIAGAADRVLGMTITHAGDRVQFGKPIGRQQAVQQQLAQMVEQVVAARIAARMGCADGLPPKRLSAAIAKQVASTAAVQVAAIAHAVHGAIGISQEHDLPLYTRRLHEWRLADGSESYWAKIVGQARVAEAGMPSVDFLRERIA